MVYGRSMFASRIVAMNKHWEREREREREREWEGGEEIGIFNLIDQKQLGLGLTEEGGKSRCNGEVWFGGWLWERILFTVIHMSLVYQYTSKVLVVQIQGASSTIYNPVHYRQTFIVIRETCFTNNKRDQFLLVDKKTAGKVSQETNIP